MSNNIYKYLDLDGLSDYHNSMKNWVNNQISRIQSGPTKQEFNDFKTQVSNRFSVQEGNLEYVQYEIGYLQSDYYNLSTANSDLERRLRKYETVIPLNANINSSVIEIEGLSDGNYVTFGDDVFVGGGTIYATVAEKLGAEWIGNENTPIYLKSGTPTVCTMTNYFSKKEFEDVKTSIDSQFETQGGNIEDAQDDIKDLREIYSDLSTVVDTLAGADFLEYQGTIPDKYSLAAVDYKKGDVYIIAKDGTYFGQKCEAGDLLICNSNSSNSDEPSNDHWNVVQTNINGAVTSSDELAPYQLVMGVGGRNVQTFDSSESAGDIIMLNSNEVPQWEPPISTNEIIDALFTTK